MKEPTNRSHPISHTDDSHTLIAYSRESVTTPPSFSDPQVKQSMGARLLLCIETFSDVSKYTFNIHIYIYIHALILSYPLSHILILSYSHTLILVLSREYVSYGVATISRLLKDTGLFGRIQSLL